ncbi:DUF1592 domain-containing protein [Agaribacterium haliotis]|uniref:DUF1592 domain-containing protein n=1 Tax=Agaribacterium haliotis TaxID=2013869 RepID=UPI0013043137|nr:DUF1592 domain-containing protein [Agaribacterium haliotis]
MLPGAGASSTPQPIVSPKPLPSGSPGGQPTVAPSAQPTVQPTTQPTVAPTFMPTFAPSAAPSAQPSPLPSAKPSPVPSPVPSSAASPLPSPEPSVLPSVEPSVEPSSEPEPEADPVNGEILMGSAMCGSCHIDNLDGTFAGFADFDVNDLKYPQDTNYTADSEANLALYIEALMPKGPAENCVGQCAKDIAAYLWSYVGTMPEPEPSSSAAPTPKPSAMPSPMPSDEPLLGNLVQGEKDYAQFCEGCHGPAGDAGSTEAEKNLYSLIGQYCETCADGDAALFEKIVSTMPPGNEANCNGQCAADTAKFIMEVFYKPNLEDDVIVSCDDGSINVGESVMKRLNKREYINTVEDLLGLDAALFADLVQGETGTGFDTAESSHNVSLIHIQGFQSAAEKIAAVYTSALQLSSGAALGGDQCNSTAQCKTSFGDSAFDCQNSASASSVCLCDTGIGSQRCDVLFPPADTGDGEALFNCSAFDDNCASSFIAKLGERAFRRPIKSDELNYLTAIYRDNKDDLGFKPALQMVVEAVLQAPEFLYRPEHGIADNNNDGVLQLSSWEVANRLSYLFWGTAPDATLRELAAMDKLRDRAVIKTQAERLLNDHKAKAVLHNYFTGWMGLDSLQGLMRNAEVYPDFDEEIPGLLWQETQSFINHVFDQHDGSFDELMTANYSFANNKLASFYGIDAPASNEFAMVYDGTKKKNHGILTHASFMATHAHDVESAPILRGAFLYGKVMCKPISAPADSDALPIEPPLPDPTKSTRERWVAQTSINSECSACHRLINPPGFVFENYDASGRWREQEVTKDDATGKSYTHAIDATAEVLGAGELSGYYPGPAEFVSALAASETVTACAVKNWGHYSYGRVLDNKAYDKCSVDQAYKSFVDSGKSIKALLVAFTQTDAFLYRTQVQ